MHRWSEKLCVCVCVCMCVCERERGEEGEERILPSSSASGELPGEVGRATPWGPSQEPSLTPALLLLWFTR